MVTNVEYRHPGRAAEVWVYFVPSTAPAATRFQGREPGWSTVAGKGPPRCVLRQAAMQGLNDEAVKATWPDCKNDVE